MRTLQAKGLSAQEALLTVAPPGKILVPLLNMEHNNSDLDAGDVIGTVQLIDDLPENPASSCARVQVSQPNLDHSKQV